MSRMRLFFFFFFQAEDGIRDKLVTGVQTCALPISLSLDPNMDRAHQHLGNIYLHIGLLDEAIVELQKALAISPREDNALRSEEHTSELQSLAYLVCRLLLEKKKKIT